MTFTTCCTNYINFNYFLRTLQVTRISIHKHLFISLFLFTVTTGLFRETFSNIHYWGIFETYSIYFGQGPKEFFGKVTYHQNNQHFDMTFSYGAVLLEKCFCRVQVNAMAIVSNTSYQPTKKYDQVLLPHLEIRSGNSFLQQVGVVHVHGIIDSNSILQNSLWCRFLIILTKYFRLTNYTWMW